MQDEYKKLLVWVWQNVKGSILWAWLGQNADNCDDFAVICSNCLQRFTADSSEQWTYDISKYILSLVNENRDTGTVRSTIRSPPFAHEIR